MLANDKMDPVLEIWIDEDGRPPALVRLVGVLDLSSSDSLLLVIRQLFDEGSRQVTIDMTCAEVALESRGHNALPAKGSCYSLRCHSAESDDVRNELLARAASIDKDESRPSI